MNLENYNFTEPANINIADNIERAVIYVVMIRNSFSWTYLYVGQTGDLSERFANHEKWNCWLRNSNVKGLFVSYLREPNKDRRLGIETELRKKLPGLICNKQ